MSWLLWAVGVAMLNAGVSWGVKVWTAPWPYERSSWVELGALMGRAVTVFGMATWLAFREPSGSVAAFFLAVAVLQLAGQFLFVNLYSRD